MKKIFIALLILGLAMLACSISPQMPTTGNQVEIFPTEQIFPTPAPHPTIRPKATDTPAPNDCTVTAQSLHVRSGAGVSYSVIGYLYAGEIVAIQTQRGAWLDIGAGWVHSKYCEVKP